MSKPPSINIISGRMEPSCPSVISFNAEAPNYANKPWMKVRM
jgi:hypothetical protein